MPIFWVFFVAFLSFLNKLAQISTNYIEQYCTLIYNICMKYWTSCLFLFVLLVGMLTFVIIDNSIGSLALQKDNITFSILENENCDEIFSGKNWNDEFQNYTLEIETKNNENFLNPKLAKSANVAVLNYSEQVSKINVQFYIKSGTSIFFELSGDNFETSRQTFLVTPFDNALEINYINLLNESGNLYNLKTEINDNVEMSVLYFVENSDNVGDAIKEEFPCVLSYACLINLQPAENCTVTSSQTSILKVDSINKKILVKRTGTASISFQVSNKSKEQKVVKTINFIVKNVPVKNITNLCDTVEIDLNVNDEYNFEFEVLPHYSQNYSIKLSENYDDDIISLSNKKIIGLKTGEVQVDFIINSEIFKTITVKVTNQSNADPDDPNSDDPNPADPDEPGSGDPNPNNPDNPNPDDPNSNDPNPDNPNPDDTDDSDNPNPDDPNPDDLESGSEYLFEICLTESKNGVSFNAESNVLSVNLNEYEGYYIQVRFEILLFDKNNNQIDPSFIIEVLPENSDLLLEQPSSINSDDMYKLCLCISIEKAGNFKILLSHKDLEAELILEIILSN